jgi:hypothetical protein
MEEKLTVKYIIDSICGNMLESVEEFPDEILIPSVYDVYLNTEDFNRLESFIDKVEDAAKRELDKRMNALNRKSRFKNKIMRWIPWWTKEPEYVVAQGDWEIRIQSDPNNKVEKSHAEIWSSFVSGNREDSLTRTKRVFKLKEGETHKVKELRRETQHIYATISYQDNGGSHVYTMAKKEVVIGRGGASVWVDLKLRTPDDVSRRHAIIRYDESSGKFFIKNIGKFETEVNGNEVFQSADDGRFDSRSIREVPAKARIELARKVTLDFEAKTRR